MPFSKKRFSALLNQLNVPKGDRENVPTATGATPENEIPSPKLKRTEWWSTPDKKTKKLDKSDENLKESKSEMPLAPTDPCMEYPSVHYTNLLPGKIPKPKKIKRIENLSANVATRLRRRSGGDAEGVLRLRRDSGDLERKRKQEKAEVKEANRIEKQEKKDKKKQTEVEKRENKNRKKPHHHQTEVEKNILRPAIAELQHDLKKIRTKRRHGDRIAGPIHFLRNLSKEAIRADDQLFVKFFKFSTCYDLQAQSAKLIVFDNKLSVTKAFYALLEHSCRAAPIWDSNLREYVGMFTITDFIKILRMSYYNSEGNINSEDLDEMLDKATFDTWTEVLGTKRDLIFAHPETSLYDAMNILLTNKIHRLPVLDPKTGNILHIITHKRLLKYLYTYIKEIPLFGEAKGLNKTATELGVGTHKDLIVATEDTSIIEALNIFIENRITAIPILDHHGRLLDMYAKFDVINLAENHSYTNLDMPIKLINQHWTCTDSPYFHGIYKCRARDTLLHIIERMVTTGVHRLFEVDDDDKVTGVIGLADVVSHLIHWIKEESSDIPSIVISDMDIVTDIEHPIINGSHTKYVVTEEEVELDQEVTEHNSLSDALEGLELSSMTCSKLLNYNSETVPDLRKPKPQEENIFLKPMTDFYNRLSPIPHSPIEDTDFNRNLGAISVSLSPSFNDKLLETVLDFRRMSSASLDTTNVPDPLLAVHDPNQDPLMLEVKDPARNCVNNCINNCVDNCVK